MHLVLAAVGELLEDVTSQHAEVLGGEEVGTGSDEAAVCQRGQRSPLSVRQACPCTTTHFLVCVMCAAVPAWPV